MLFQGIKLLFTNWRLTLVQILPAMWIWAAMLDLKAHALHGHEFHIFHGPLLGVVLLVIAGLTAGSFYLNAVFAFAISRPGPPEIRPGFSESRRHLRTILAWGLVVGLALGFATMVVDRWGKVWFSVTLGDRGRRHDGGLRGRAGPADRCEVGTVDEGTSWPPPPSAGPSGPWCVPLRSPWAGWPS